MPRVSVVIPAYNAERFIGEALCSVLSQTFQDFEILVVDDGSTDGTREEVVAFEDDRIRYMAQANRGPSAARNAGIRAASGQFIVCLDADDLWRPNMLRACVDRLDARPEVSVVHARWLFADAGGRPVGRETTWLPWAGDVFERLVLRNPFVTPGVVLRRVCFDQCGLFDEHPLVADDWDMWLRLARQGYLFDYVDAPLVLYRRHEDNLTSSEDRGVAARFYILEKLFSDPTLPERIKALEDRALARVHLKGAVLGLRHRDMRAAEQHIFEAVVRDPRLLEDRSTYYRLACDTRLPGQPLTADSVDLERAEENLLRLLRHTFAQADLPEEVLAQRRDAVARAYLSLAQIAYGIFEDSTAARRYLFRSLRFSPKQIGTDQMLLWLFRTVLGRDLILGLGKLVGLVLRNPTAMRGIQYD